MSERCEFVFNEKAPYWETRRRCQKSKGHADEHYWKLSDEPVATSTPKEHAPVTEEHRKLATNLIQRYPDMTVYDVQQFLADALAEARRATPTNDALLAALDGLYHDSHHWSSRPCETCDTMTKAIGVPFGCDKFRKLAAAQRKSMNVEQT